MSVCTPCEILMAACTAKYVCCLLNTYICSKPDIGVVGGVAPRSAPRRRVRATIAAASASVSLGAEGSCSTQAPLSRASNPRPSRSARCGASSLRAARHGARV